jgi:hypothetical protein
VLERFVSPVPHPKGHGHYVVGVVAIGILTQGALEMIERARMIT